MATTAQVANIVRIGIIIDVEKSSLGSRPASTRSNPSTTANIIFFGLNSQGTSTLWYDSVAAIGGRFTYYNPYHPPPSLSLTVKGRAVPIIFWVQGERKNGPFKYTNIIKRCPGGQLMNTTEVENFPGFPEGITSLDLKDRMRSQAEHWGEELFQEDVEFVDLNTSPFLGKLGFVVEIWIAAWIVISLSKLIFLPYVWVTRNST
uniref:Uncharacterized protein n=1 Tax=Lactuca sativa TaxID=4236 RepID=A0A9R1UMG6_LACSA|nr:hypothetical protein LSAT_V11C800421260 [Lactuca sativa]